MATQYDTYLSSLRRAKMNRPEMDIYKRNMRTLTEPFNLLNNQMASLTQRGGASSAKQMASLKAGRDQWNAAQNEAYNQALTVESGRQERLDTAIAETELKKSEFERMEAERLKAEKDARNKEKRARQTGALRTGLQLAGMGVGALLAPVTGGASAIVTSALLGGAIGQTAGGFVGVDKGGQLTVKPEDWDMDAIGQGLSSVATQVAYNANQAETKNKLSLFSQYAPDIQRGISTMTPQQADMFRMQMQSALLNGSYQDLQTIISGLGR